MLTMQPVPPGSESFATCVTYLTERLAAEAVGPRVRCPWSWPSLCLPVGRKRAELLHQGEEVRHAPVLGDLAVVHPHGIDGVEVDLAAGGGHSEERPLVGAVVRLEGGHDLAVRGLPMDHRVEVGKRGPKRMVQVARAGLVRGSPGLRRVVAEIVGEELLVQTE